MVNKKVPGRVRKNSAADAVKYSKQAGKSKMFRQSVRKYEVEDGSVVKKRQIKENGRVIGSIEYVINPDNTSYIIHVDTFPSERRRKVASFNLYKTLVDLKAKGVNFVALYPTDMAKKMYEDFGFTRKSKRGGPLVIENLQEKKIPLVLRVKKKQQ